MSFPQPKLPTAATLIRKHSRAAYIATIGTGGKVIRHRDGAFRSEAVSQMINKYRK